MAWQYNPTTGEAVTLSPDGTWVPTKTATNPQTGEKLVLDGAEWKPLTITASEKPAEAPDRGTVINALRKAEFGSQGFIDRAAEILTAPADWFWDGVKWVNKIADQENVPEGYRIPTPDVSASDSLKNLIHSGQRAGTELMAPILPDMGPNVPETKGERVAQKVGEGAADVGSFLVPGMAANRLARAGSTLQLGGKVMAAQPGTQVVAGGVGSGVTEATDNPWYGLAASMATPAGMKAGARVITPVRSTLNEEAQRLATHPTAASAKTLDIPLTAGQATDSRPLKSLESMFATFPLTSSAQQQVRRTQQEAFNNAALKFIGEDKTLMGTPRKLATDEVLDSARDRIGAEIRSLAAQTTVQLDNTFQTGLMKTVMEYGRTLDTLKRPVYDNLVRDIADFIQSGMPGDIYQTTRSRLSGMARSYEQTDQHYAKALRELRDELDSAADRSMPDHLKNAWRDARREWGHLRTIEKSRSNTTTAAAGGDIPPTQLAQAAKNQYRRAYGFGAGGMNKLSKIGTTFVRDPIPNSGTPERLFWQNLLTNPVTALGALGTGTGAASLAGFDPLMSGITTAATLATPKLTQMAYNSRPGQAWLKNKVMLDRTPQYNLGLLGMLGAENLPDGLLGQ